MKSLVTSIIFYLLLLSGSAKAEVVYLEDGGYHYVNDTRYLNDYVRLDYNIVNVPGTHLDLVNGGSIRSLSAINNATVTMTGGSVSEYLTVRGSSRVTMAGGSVEWDFDAFDNANVTMSGGLVVDDLVMFGKATSTMSGGLVAHDLVAHDKAMVTMTGGTIGNELFAFANGTIYLEGSGFQVTDLYGVATDLLPGDKLSNYGTLVENGDSDYYAGTITGTLTDESFLDNTFEIYNTDYNFGYADIVIIPEPATFALLVAGAFFIRRKR